MTFHLFFEQSGTFKNELRKLGYEAIDYDILNDFGQTDVVIDLFAEIEKSYAGGGSIFDKIGEDDMIIAFFPCVRFEDQIIMNLRGDHFAGKRWDDQKRIEYSMKLHSELAHMYQLISKLVIVCIRKKIALVIENPYSSQHYLTRYWPLKPAIVDQDRRRDGDWYKKPTQYWFINCKPKNNMLFEPIEFVEERVIEKTHNQVQRSMIHPQYANRFLRQYILPERSRND